jgi:acetyl-CoA acetyltransferase
MSAATDAVIVTAIRTPIGRSGRSRAVLTIQDIGMQTVAGAIAASGIDPDDIEDVVLGEVLEGGGCTARYVANALGLPPNTPGGAVQRQCATGMMAVQDAAANIRSGMADVIVGGGAAASAWGRCARGAAWVRPPFWRCARRTDPGSSITPCRRLLPPGAP